MACGVARERSVILWSAPAGVLKFNITQGKLGQAGIGRVLQDDKGVVLATFSKAVGVKDSNEAELLAILEGLRLFIVSFQGRLVVETYSLNAIF